ncbi:MAG: class I SAM-dependent methyltransferase [Acidobacteriaceae bacterium]
MLNSIQSHKVEILESLFRDYDGPSFSIRIADGWQWAPSGRERAACTFVFSTADALKALMLHADELTLGEAFIRKDMDVEGDIFAAFAVAEHIFNRRAPLPQKIVEHFAGTIFNLRKWARLGPPHSIQRDKASIAYHYDLPVEFYRPWLGETMAYSCAYFRSPEDSLDIAQEQKLDLICRKLRLQPLDQFLDIGCGWGSLVLHAAQKYRVHAHGITISEKQAEVTKDRIGKANLTQSCSVELRDYRQTEMLNGCFDEIASVGMVEHVGLKRLPQYFNHVYKLLKPGGVFLNHGITRAVSSLPRSASFMDRYVFPDGRLVTLAQIIHAAESSGFEVKDVENLREHYELTLRRWVEGLRKNKDILLKTISEETYRIWLLYMAGSAAAFHRGDISVYQTLLSRNNSGVTHIPLTREDWYS